MTDYLSKLDFGLQQIHLRHVEGIKTSDAKRRVTVILRYTGDLAQIEALGFETDWRGSGGEAGGVLPLAKLEAIASHANVISLSAGTRPRRLLGKSVKDIRARAVAPGDVPGSALWHVNTSTGVISATGGATGRGVIIGVIDTGIDVSHPVFNTTQFPFATRILRIWDQGLTPDTALGEHGPVAANLLSTHTYGVEFESDDINDALNSSLIPIIPLDFKHKDCDGHGTHVAATAAGNGQTGGGASADFVGVAPEADLIVVKFIDTPEEIKDVRGSEVSWTRRFRDAMIYVLRIARAAGKPVVLNLSFGFMGEAHDGLSDDERWMDRVFDPDPAHAADAEHFPEKAIVVKGAGNEGDIDRREHAKITVPDAGKIIVPFEMFDTRGAHRSHFLNCVPEPHVPELVVYLWYKEVATPADVAFASRVPTDAGFSDDVFSGSLTKRFGGNRRRWIVHDVTPTVDRPGGGGTVTVHRNRCFLQIEPNERVSPPQHTLGIYDVRIKAPPGTVVHAWCWRETRFGFRVAEHYRNGDPLPAPEHVAGSAAPIELIEVTGTSTVSDSGARNIIAAAAYDDKNGATGHAEYSHVAPFSSRGPLVDYSNPPLGPLADKPDIAGPGVDIKAALSIEMREGVGVSTESEIEGNRFVEFSGTSMATPHVAGVVALMFQKTPTMTIDDVRTVFRTRANVRDGTNPPTPGTPEYDAAYGEGIVDAKKSHTAS